MKKRFLYFAPDKRDTTSFFRVSAVLPFVHHETIDLWDISDNKIFDWTTFINVHAMIFQRPFGAEHLNVIMGAKNMGVKIITDYDDMLLDVNIYNPTHQLYKAHQASLIECLKLSDEIWVSTNAIRESYLPYNKNIHIIPNAFNDYLFPVSKKKSFNMDSQKVCWRGGSSHSADVMSIADELVKIINSNPNWDFNFCGSRFEYIEMRTGDNHGIVPYMSIIEFFRYFNFENPNACIFPLVNNAFNRGKSNISLLESTYAGACFFGNKDLPEFNLDCVIPIGRLNEIGTMPKEEMRKYNEDAWGYVQDNLLLSNINRLRTERLLQI